MRVAAPGQMPRNLLDNLEFKILPRWYLAAFGPPGIGVVFFVCGVGGPTSAGKAPTTSQYSWLAQEDDRSH